MVPKAAIRALRRFATVLQEPVPRIMLRSIFLQRIERLETRAAKQCRKMSASSA